MHPAAKFLRDLEDISDVLDTPETEHNGLEMVKATTSEIGVISRIENEGEVVKSSKRPLKSASKAALQVKKQKNSGLNFFGGFMKNIFLRDDMLTTFDMANKKTMRETVEQPQGVSRPLDKKTCGIPPGVNSPEVQHVVMSRPEVQHVVITSLEGQQVVVTDPEQQHIDISGPEDQHAVITIPEDQRMAATNSEDQSLAVTSHGGDQGLDVTSLGGDQGLAVTSHGGDQGLAVTNRTEDHNIGDLPTGGTEGDQDHLSSDRFIIDTSVTPISGSSRVKTVGRPTRKCKERSCDKCNVEKNCEICETCLNPGLKLKCVKR